MNDSVCVMMCVKEKGNERMCSAVPFFWTLWQCLAVQKKKYLALCPTSNTSAIFHHIRKTRGSTNQKYSGKGVDLFKTGNECEVM